MTCMWCLRNERKIYAVSDNRGLLEQLRDKLNAKGGTYSVGAC